MDVYNKRLDVYIPKDSKNLFSFYDLWFSVVHHFNVFRTEFTYLPLV